MTDPSISEVDLTARPGTRHEVARSPVAGCPVSVVIPTVGRDSLAASVGSIATQTARVFEVVVAVDSNHAIPQELVGGIADLLGAVGVRLVVLNRAGTGAGAVRRAGILAARGEYVALLDDDDYWMPHHVRSALDRLVGRPLDVYSARAATIVDDRDVVVRPSLERVFPGTASLAEWFYGPSRLARTPPASIPTPSVVLRQDLAAAVPMDLNLTVSEDYAWLLDLGAQGARLSQSPTIDVLVHYDSMRSGRRSSAAQSLAFASHVDANCPGMAVRYLVHYAAPHFARRGRAAEVAQLAEAVGQSQGATSRDQAIMAGLARLAQGVALLQQRRGRGRGGPRPP